MIEKFHAYVIMGLQCVTLSVMTQGAWSLLFLVAAIVWFLMAIGDTVD